jgi:hypothetical protein
VSFDRRESLRSAMDLPAHILGANGSRVPCTVIDRSASGLMLAVGEALGLPESFTLIVGQSGEIRDVRVAWRQPDRLGVTFA